MSDKRLVTVLNALVKPTRRKELKPLEPRGALPGKRSFAEYTPTPSRTGGGIASPLVEQSYAERTWWPNGLPSSDGIFEFPADRRVTMTDSNGALVIFEYAEPT